MANDITGNPIIVDTVANHIWPRPGNLKVKHFELVPNAANDTVTVTDRNGRTLWIGKAPTVTNVVSQDIGWIEGLSVTVLTANAKLLVYIE